MKRTTDIKLFIEWSPPNSSCHFKPISEISTVRPDINDLPTVSETFNENEYFQLPRHLWLHTDGTQIPISTPLKTYNQETPVTIYNQESYHNRKGFHTVVLQAVVREDARFTDISVGMLGSTHDARVCV